MDDDDKEESSNKTKERAEDQKVMWDKLRTFEHKLPLKIGALGYK